MISRAFFVLACYNRGHVDAVEMIMTEYLSLTFKQTNFMNMCIFTVIIPVSLSEDQDYFVHPFRL